MRDHNQSPAKQRLLRTYTACARFAMRVGRLISYILRLADAVTPDQKSLGSFEAFAVTQADSDRFGLT